MKREYDQLWDELIELKAENERLRMRGSTITQQLYASVIHGKWVSAMERIAQLEDDINSIPDSLVGAKPPTKKNEGKKKSKFIVELEAAEKNDE